MSMGEGMAREVPIRNGRPWAGPIGLLASCLGAWLILLSTRLSVPGLGLPGDFEFNCAGQPLGIEGKFRMFYGTLDWQAMIILEGVAAFFTVALAASVIRGVWVRKDPAYKLPLIGLFAVGIGLLLADFVDLESMMYPAVFGRFVGGMHNGLLSVLLDTLPEACASVRHQVVLGRIIGEPSGLAIGFAMFAAVTLPRSTTAAEMARRSRSLGQLLYAASILFVIGLLMTRANLSWIMAQWDWANLGYPADTQKEIVERGVKLAGVAYSAILAMFYLPARWILQSHVDQVVPDGKQTRGTQVREAWLKENGFAAGWRDDIKQILAVLAPVLAAPVFETLAK